MLENVFKVIDDNRDACIERLQALCRQPSIGTTGEGMAETADMVARIVRQTGARTEQIATDSYPVILGDLPGSDPRCINLYNHYDVQPPDPVEAWTSDPFGAEIRDGFLYARGAADDKGELLSRVCAVEAWQQVQQRPPVGVRFVFEGNEESGGESTVAFARRHADRLRANGCIWEYGDKDAERRTQMYLGLKGICAVQLHARGPSRNTHSMWGPVVPNPMWRLVWALASIKHTDERIHVRGFYDRVRAPTEAELEALERLPLDVSAACAMHGIASFLAASTKNEVLRRLNFEPALTIHGISGGGTGPQSTTSIPKCATVKMDFRLVPDQRLDEVVPLLRAHLDREGFSDIDVEFLGGSNPTRTPLDDPLVDAAVRAAQCVYGTPPAVHPTSPGSGPMYVLCKQLGIPAVSFGIAHAGSNFHGPDENVRLDDFILGIKHVAATLYAFATPEGVTNG